MLIWKLDVFWLQMPDVEKYGLLVKLRWTNSSMDDLILMLIYAHWNESMSMFLVDVSCDECLCTDNAVGQLHVDQ
jgi:hypothetical protein